MGTSCIDCPPTIVAPGAEVHWTVFRDNDEENALPRGSRRGVQRPRASGEM